MARSASFACRAPLPAYAEARLHRSVGLRLSTALDGSELVGLIVALCVPWLLASRDRLGQEADNCLAKPPYRKTYAAEMKHGQTAFWRIDPADQPDSPAWVVAISLENGIVQKLEHVGGFTFMPRDRYALLEFLMVHVRIGYSREIELLAFALSPCLVAASRAGAILSVGALFAGSVWRFEGGSPGVLAAMPTNGPAVFQFGLASSWMLHGARTSAGTTLSVQTFPGSDVEDGAKDSDDGDDGEVASRPAAGPQTMVELEVRLALREACRGSPALRRACREAFAAESPLFIQDWFGIVPHAALTVARLKPGSSAKGTTHAV